MARQTGKSAPPRDNVVVQTVEAGARDYFFVVGAPRSGTTLLSVVLDRHSRLSVPPETNFFDEIAWRLWRSSGRFILKELRRWPRVSELKLEPETIVCRMARRRPVRRELLAAMLDLYAERKGKARCGEKTPQHLRHVPAILRFFPNARVVCMLRDGREAALSLRSMPWYGGTLQTAAAVWRKSVRRMEKFARRYPSRFTIVRYEELVASPERELRSVMAFLGEPFEPRQMSIDVPSDVVLSRSMDWKGEALRSVDRRAAGRRLETAAPADVAFLDRVLRNELPRYGYVTGA